MESSSDWTGGSGGGKWEREGGRKIAKGTTPNYTKFMYSN